MKESDVSGVGERERERKRRWISPEMRALYKETLRIRDGSVCRICRESESEVDLQIDHINGDPNDWRLENLRLLDQRCNNREFHRLRQEAARDSVARVCVRENALRSDEVERKEKSLDFRLSMESSSAELKVNRDKEPSYRREVINGVSRDGFMSVASALDAVCELLGLSQVTARRYLKKMTSAVGPLKVEETNQGTKILKLNEKYWALESNQVADKK